MTLNSVNCEEIEAFVDLALSYDAQPLILLVTNPYQEIKFQKDFLTFTPKQFKNMHAAIDRSIPKVQKRGFDDAEIYLKQRGRETTAWCAPCSGRAPQIDQTINVNLKALLEQLSSKFVPKAETFFIFYLPEMPKAETFVKFERGQCKTSYTYYEF